MLKTNNFTKGNLSQDKKNVKFQILSDQQLHCESLYLEDLDQSTASSPPTILFGVPSFTYDFNVKNTLTNLRAESNKKKPKNQSRKSELGNYSISQLFPRLCPFSLLSVISFSGVCFEVDQNWDNCCFPFQSLTKIDLHDCELASFRGDLSPSKLEELFFGLFVNSEPICESMRSLKIDRLRIEISDDCAMDNSEISVIDGHFLAKFRELHELVLSRIEINEKKIDFFEQYKNKENEENDMIPSCFSSVRSLSIEQMTPNSKFLECFKSVVDIRFNVVEFCEDIDGFFKLISGVIQTIQIISCRMEEKESYGLALITKKKPNNMSFIFENKYFPRCTSLDLSKSDVFYDGAFLGNFPCLRALNLSELFSIEDEKFSEQIRKLTNLRHLNLEGCKELKDFKIFDKMHNLIYVDLSRCNGLMDYLAIWTLLENNQKTLRTLNFANCSTSAISKAFTSIIQYESAQTHGIFNNLRELNISNCCQLDDSILYQFNNLRNLIIHGKGFGFSNNCLNEKQKQKLRFLSVEHNDNFTNDFLEGLPNLNRLNAKHSKCFNGFQQHLPKLNDADVFGSNLVLKKIDIQE